MDLPESYQNLINAIILRAVKDYRRALRGLQKYPHYPLFIKRKKDVEAFFRSQWFRDLCDLDGETMLRKLQKEVNT